MGTFPQWGFRLCLIFDSFEFINDFNSDLISLVQGDHLLRKEIMAFLQGNL